MSPDLRSLAQQHPEIILFLAVLIFGLGVLHWNLRRQVVRMRARWKDLLQDGTGQSLESLLYDHLRGRIRAEEEIEDAKRRISQLEEAMKSAKRYVGLVRYDAFEDVGGSQSFALAVYDDNGNGAVLSGIVGRSDCRVYCKPLINGRSERDLSQEEQRAIRDARTEAPRSIISP